MKFRAKLFLTFVAAFASMSAVATASYQSSSIKEESVVAVTDASVWDGLDYSTYGAAFRASLAAKIKATRRKTCSYDATLAIGQNAASYPKGSNRFVPFYHTTDTVVSGGCNREHVWPNSRGAGKSGPGADPHIIRPTLTSENSDRGNSFFGTTGNTWDPASCGFEGARGEAARVILYAATAYYDTCGTGGSSNGNIPLSLSNNPGDANNSHTMGRLDTLLEWNATYPVTAMEIQINNYLADAGYARNPFVDYPVLANYIWDKNGLRNSPYQDGGENIPSSTSSNPSSSSVPDDGSGYRLVKDVNELNAGDKVVIVSEDPDASGSYLALTSSAKSDSLPWYLIGCPATFNGEKLEYLDAMASWTVGKENGKYQFKLGSKSLFHYVDSENHYSIGVGSPGSDGSVNWSIQDMNPSSGLCQLYGEKGVYLEYYKSSFCGYRYKPNIGIRFFAYSDGEEIPSSSSSEIPSSSSEPSSSIPSSESSSTTVPSSSESGSSVAPSSSEGGSSRHRGCRGEVISGLVASSIAMVGVIGVALYRRRRPE